MPNQNKYCILVSDTARKNLRRMPASQQKRILGAIKALGEEPRPRTCIALKAYMGYRICVGDQRVIYVVDDTTKIVTILTVKHRREAYRDL